MSYLYAGICRGAENPLSNNKGKADVHIKDEDISLALQCWYMTGSKEVVKFNKEYVAKVTEEKNGILLCKSRIMDGQRFITTAGFDEDNLGGEVQLNMRTPCCRTSRDSQTGPC